MHFVKKYTADIKHHIMNSPSTKKLLRLGRKCYINFILSNADQYTEVPVVKRVLKREKDNLVITSDPCAIL